MLYHHHLKAFAGLTPLLAARFDGDPLIVDMMHVGFWGEAHFGGNPSPFPDFATAPRTLNQMVHLQLAAWKKTPLAMNTQPDISNTGNREAMEIAVRGGAWLRSDSIIIEEPIQIEEQTNRPPWLASILEDGYLRSSNAPKLPVDAAGVNELENYMLHVLDLNANYWSLWTESEHLADSNRQFPRGFKRLRANMGYLLRPSWVRQRKRSGTSELVLAISNRGVAGVPSVLWLQIASPDGAVEPRGSLDPGHPPRRRSSPRPFPAASPVRWNAPSIGRDRNQARRPQAHCLGVRAACECGRLDFNRSETTGRSKMAKRRMKRNSNPTLAV